MRDVPDADRRRFLAGSAGAAVAGLAGFAPTALAQAQKPKEKPLPGYVSWKDADRVIVHTGNTIETERSAFGTSFVTPTAILFVRNNLSPPKPAIADDPDRWQLAVEGVAKPRKLTVGDLKRIGLSTVPMVLQCSGNGRGFFEHKASGTQWKVGAAGCAIWSGVPVSELAKALGGVAGGMKFMTSTGGEELPQGVDPATLRVERSVPLDAMETAILAWELNGEPIPLGHGGPLRIVIPGYYGVNNVKYVQRLAFTPEETRVAIQRTGYRVRPIGQKGAPDQPSMWRLNVKSWINQPLGGEPLRPGTVQVHGVAFSGNGPVKRVEISPDGGKTWKNARFLEPDFGPHAWRQFVLPLELKAGTHVLASRATDAKGETQPEQRQENERGYAHNGWRDHAVSVKVG